MLVVNALRKIPRRNSDYFCMRR